MFNVRLAGGHLYGKQLFTWLSLVVSFMASFVLSFFPLDVLDGIWDLIESVSEGFLTYFFKLWSGHKKLLTDTHTKKENYITHCKHTLYAGDITRVTVHVFWMSSHVLTFVRSFLKVYQAVLNL